MRNGRLLWETLYLPVVFYWPPRQVSVSEEGKIIDGSDQHSQVFLGSYQIEDLRVIRGCMYEYMSCMYYVFTNVYEFIYVQGVN